METLKIIGIIFIFIWLWITYEIWKSPVVDENNKIIKPEKKIFLIFLKKTLKFIKNGNF